jgi:hypothetical protein
MARFNEGIGPTVPLVLYTQKHETCQELTHDSNIPISEETKETTGNKNAFQCGGFMDVWQRVEVQVSKPANMV